MSSFFPPLSGGSSGGGGGGGLFELVSDLTPSVNVTSIAFAITEGTMYRLVCDIEWEFNDYILLQASSDGGSTGNAMTFEVDQTRIFTGAGSGESHVVRTAETHARLVESHNIAHATIDFINQNGNLSIHTQASSQNGTTNWTTDAIAASSNVAATDSAILKGLFSNNILANSPVKLYKMV